MHVDDVVVPPVATRRGSRRSRGPGLRPTLTFGGITDTPDAFQARWYRAAAALRELGIGPNAVVAFMLHNEPMHLELRLAARALGARWCAVPAGATASELQQRLVECGASLLLLHTDLLAGAVAGIPHRVQVCVATPQVYTRQALDLPGDTVGGGQRFIRWEHLRDGQPSRMPPEHEPGTGISYTAGTDDRPKGIERGRPSREQQQARTELFRSVFGLQPGMRCLVSAPLHHSAAAAYLLNAAMEDAHIVVEPRFDAERTLHLVESLRLTHLYAVPAMFVRLLRLAPEICARYDVSSIRFVACTGAPCPAEIKRQMIEWWGPVIHESYGACEVGFVTHADSLDALQRPGTVGRALRGATVRVLDAAGGPVSAGTVGRIHARHAALQDFRYLHESAPRTLARGGLLPLGDVGYLDGDGYLFLVDRESDVIRRDGEPLYSAEIESALLAMPEVADCAVFGVPDDVHGEAVAAVVELLPGSQAAGADVQAFLSARLPLYKVPSIVTFQHPLPRDDGGKLRKQELRAPYWADRVRPS